MPEMAGYTKLFNSILASTIWNEDNDTRIVWITLLAMAGKNGIAEGSVPGIAVFARLPVDATRKALEKLAAPDPDSRSQEHDGRRIEAVDGGWLIINHAKYRAKMSTDERREYLRVKQAEYRKARKQKSTNVNNVSDKYTELTQPKAEAKADTEKIKSVPRALSRGEGSGVMGGSLPRDHLYCRPPCIRVCVSERLHAVLRSKYGGDPDVADAALDAFYAEVRANLPDTPIGDTAWKFWEGQFAARFGVQQIDRRAASNRAAAEKFIARGRTS